MSIKTPTLADLSWSNSLCYLATPYSKFPTGIEDAFKAACILTGVLLRKGVKVYSPIAHTHPIAIHGGIDPLDHDIWLPFDQAMMEAAGICVVAMLPTWEQSYGISVEIETFRKAGKPVFYLNPETLELSDAP